MITALLLATALNAASPDWVGGVSTQYPPERFVTGVGVAEDRASAEARARAAISAVFETRVASVSRVKEEEVRATVAGRDATTTSTRLAMSQEVVAVTAAVLEGATIAAAWIDPSGQVYALAVLDRAAAAAVIGRRLAESDGAVVDALARLDKEPDRAVGARLGYRIAALLGRREGLAIRLRALDPSATAEAPAAMVNAAARAQRALAAATVRIDATGPGAEAVAAAAARALLAVGLGAVGPQPKAALVASVTVEETPSVASGAWTIARSAARVRLVSEGSSEAWAEVAESAKGTATNPAEAARRASAALAKQVEDRLAEALRKELEKT